MAAFWLAAVLAGVVLLAGAKGPDRVWVRATRLDPVTGAAAADVRNPWGLAVKLATEDRGEPTGRQAKVEVPGQLRHYTDTRRFLAIQVAEWREHSVSTPHDYAGLAEMIGAGELVAVPSVTDAFVLFGVGGLADTEPFTHYDKTAGRSVALFDDAELAREHERLRESAAQVRAEIDSLKRESLSLGKRERTRRAALNTQLAQKERSLKTWREKTELLDSFYENDERRRTLSAERDHLAALAANFDGHAYDLNDARARKELKVRMLGYLRPEALAVLRELAVSYHEKFGRPLPITSLVRPDEYQHRLSRTNANATLIDAPPHSTGLAFDILYRHMTAEEQAHVMNDIARLRDAGRVEALRENRDHFHVFAFIDGQRPDEDLIRGSLNHSASVKPREETEASTRPAKKETRTEKKRVEKKKVARKETSKRVSKTAARRRR